MTPTEEATARTLLLALIHRYASVARENGHHNKTAKLFEPEAVVQFPDGRSLPASKIGEIISGNRPRLLRHHLTTVDVRFVSEDEAHCQSYIIAGTNYKMPDHWGRWDDVVRKQGNGRWLFRKKIVVMDGLDPEGWLAKSFGVDAFMKEEANDEAPTAWFI